MKIILSTRNPSKLKQIKAIFVNSPIAIHDLDEMGIVGEAIEDGLTLEENALKKALFAKKDGFWTMADDTGIFINALDGEPGIYASRWAGETSTPEETLNYCLKRLEGIVDRSAIFKTVVSLISPDGQEYIFTGQVEGIFLETPRTKFQAKMPYSSIFVPVNSTKTWAEMSVEEENAISHRGQAFRQVVEFLKNL